MPGDAMNEIRSHLFTIRACLDIPTLPERLSDAGVEAPEPGGRRPEWMRVKANLGEEFRVSSDGGAADWDAARNWCQRVLGYVPLTEDPTAWFTHLILPWFVLSILLLLTAFAGLGLGLLELVDHAPPESGPATGPADPCTSGFVSPSAGAGAQCTISPRPSVHASWTVVRNASGPRGVDCVGPHQWPETASPRSARVKAT
mgnify:CR=1 FL=1